jgi:hypothetical protein
MGQLPGNTAQGLISNRSSTQPAYVPNAASHTPMGEALVSPLALASRPTYRDHKIAVAESGAITIWFEHQLILASGKTIRTLQGIDNPLDITP